MQRSPSRPLQAVHPIIAEKPRGESQDCGAVAYPRSAPAPAVAKPSLARKAALVSSPSSALAFLQVLGAEALGKPAVDRREQVMGFAHPPLVAHQLRIAGRG